MSNLPKSFQIALKYPTDNPITEKTIRTTSQDGNHIVGSCKVGAVIDGSFRVKGFTNLRVVDSSSIPVTVTNAGPVSSVYMLAEFAAEKLVTQYQSIQPGRKAKM
jgi:choline dehydrogenase-like flavoprotein